VSGPKRDELERAAQLLAETPALRAVVDQFRTRARRPPYRIGDLALVGIAAGYELGRARGLEMVRAAVQGSAELVLQQLAAAPARRGRKRRGHA
jgi:hypothetical protein